MANDFLLQCLRSGFVHNVRHDGLESPNALFNESDVQYSCTPNHSPWRRYSGLFLDHVRRLLPDCECINLGDQSAESVRGSVRLADCSWGGRFDLRLFDFENAFG